MSEARYYGVSTGNGNSGVSHIFPNYYVKTNDPWRLARIAALSEFKAGEEQVWASENMEIDGEEDHTIYVTFYESKETQDERAAMQEKLDKLLDEKDNLKDNKSDEYVELTKEIENLESEIEAFGNESAWFIFEVFPETEKDMRESVPAYESLDDAFGADMMEMVPADSP